ncbi:hypothetical protein [Sinorhizobium psoraleae]|uniref:Uncharacterized protein n=1 Tax=Sinorhizobium psoraleae TaxID=520838 RepID=A0ABT4KBX1_9HYPH|nr:hypothetical protein [Sinorhizobium psoraleae]MCZ4089338.1 hypothetical protein [Sinorhizobium psoraleae]
MPQGRPVVIASNGRGRPVKEATNGFGEPVTLAANGFGEPVVLADRGEPIVFTASGTPSVSVRDSEVSAADQATYAFPGVNLGAGLIVIAGVWRAAAPVTIDAVTVASGHAVVDVTSINGQTGAFIAHIVNSEASGDVVLTFSGTVARCGFCAYRIVNFTESAAYLTGTATRDTTAGPMSPNLTGSLSTGVAIGVAFNGQPPGHRISTASRTTTPQTNMTITCDCQASDTTWSADFSASEDIDVQLETAGTAATQAACVAAFR